MAPEKDSGPSSEDGVSKRKWPSAIPRWIGVALFIYGSVYVLSDAKSLLVPIVLAFLLSMVFSPVRRFFDRHGVPSALSSLVIVLTLLVSLFVLLSALALPATNWIENAPQIEAQIQEKLSAVSQSFNGIWEANEKLQSLTRSDSPDVQSVQIEDSGIATNVAFYAPSMLAQFVFTLVLLLFLLASGDMFYEKLVHVTPTFKDKKRALRIAHNIERKLSYYLLTITIINAGLGVAVGVTMWLFGMPNPLVFGLIAFIFNFVPYLGALVGIVVAMLVAIVSFAWIGWSLIIGAVYLSLTSIEGQIITPYFVGRSLRLNTVVVFIAVSFWAWLWSAVGMIVAVPLLITVKTFCEHIEGLDSFGDFLSERHAEEADEMA